MQAPAIQTVKDAWGAAFNRRDRSGFLNLHSDDVVFHDPTLPKPLRGRSELGDWFDGLFKMFPDCRLNIEHVYSVDDWVCAEGTESGTMKGPIKHPKGEVPATGKSFSMDVVLVCRVGDEGIVEVRDFYDVLALMSQLGLQA